MKRWLLLLTIACRETEPPPPKKPAEAPAPQAVQESLEKAEARKALDRIFTPRGPVTKASAKDLERYFTQKGLALIQSGQLEAFRVHSAHPLDERPAPPKNAPKVGGYAVLSGPVSVPKAVKDALVTQLLDRTSDDVGGNKFCGGFRPGVALRFKGTVPSESVAVLLCFACADLMVVHEGKSGARSEARIVNMSTSERELLKLVRLLFPNDADLRELAH
jgi:hypothetical protein